MTDLTGLPVVTAAAAELESDLPSQRAKLGM